MVITESLEELKHAVQMLSQTVTNMATDVATIAGAVMMQGGPALTMNRTAACVPPFTKLPIATFDELAALEEKLKSAKEYKSMVRSSQLLYDIMITRRNVHP